MPEDKVTEEAEAISHVIVYTVYGKIFQIHSNFKGKPLAALVQGTYNFNKTHWPLCRELYCVEHWTGQR